MDSSTVSESMTMGCSLLQGCEMIWLVGQCSVVGVVAVVLAEVCLMLLSSNVGEVGLKAVAELPVFVCDGR